MIITVTMTLNVPNVSLIVVVRTSLASACEMSFCTTLSSGMKRIHPV